MLTEEYPIIFAPLSHLKNQRRPVLSMDMPLAVAQLGHVQEHLQELQWNLSSPMELQWNLNRAPVRIEQEFSSGNPVELK